MTKTKYYIDQSGKIEQTNKNTILCLSNRTWDAVFVKAKTKRQIQEIFRRNGQIRNYVIFTFCASLSLLIKRNLELTLVTIDREYYGKESTIKAILLKMLRKKKKIPEIRRNFSGNKNDRGRQATEGCLSDEWLRRCGIHSVKKKITYEKNFVKNHF